MVGSENTFLQPEIQAQL